MFLKSWKCRVWTHSPTKNQASPFCPMQMVKTAGATSQQGVSSESTFFNLGYTLEKVKIFNFSLNAVIASVRLIQDCQLKYRLITYGELSRRHWYSGSLVGDSLLPFKPSNPLPIQLVRGCSIYKVIRSYVRACWWGNVQSKKSKFPSCNLCKGSHHVRKVQFFWTLFKRPLTLKLSIGFFFIIR